MSVTALRTISINFSGDVNGTETITAASNVASPGSIQILTLSAGANTITVPTGGTTPVAATIVPPAGNAVSIIFKGITGDTGVRLHNTDPSAIAIDSSVTTFVLTAGGTITGLRIYWS